MKTFAIADIKLIAIPLALAGIIVGSILLLGSDGPVHQWTGLDFRYLTGALTVFGLLMLLGNLAGLVQRRSLSRRLIGLSSRLGVWQERGDLRWAEYVLPVAQRLLTYAGWTALLAGFLGSMPNVAGTMSGHPFGSELGHFSPYLEAFGPLSSWTVIFLAPFIAIRAAAVIWPVVGQVVKLPWVRLLALASSYVALAENGVFSVAFEFSGSGILPWLALTLILSYCGSTLANAVERAPTRRLRISAQVLFFLAEASWVAAFIGSLGALSSAASTLPMEKYGQTAASLDFHLENLRSLTKWTVIFLATFTSVRAVGVVWPIVGKIFGFPILRLALLGITYTVFADKGILPVLFEFNTSQVFLVLSLALALSYLSSILRNIAEILASTGYDLFSMRALGAGSAVGRAAVPSMVVWVVFNHLPPISALLIDHSLTSDFGETHLPHFGAVYDLRYALAALVFATGLSVTLPNVLKTTQGISNKPLTAALGYSIVACLTWICGSSLSPLGHGFALFGAIAASGIFTLALCELARYAVASPNYVLADVSDWLAQSKIRCFVLGASIAFYGLLLRPVVYEMLWFAALYEYLAVLVLLLMLLLVSTSRARAGAVALSRAPPVWTSWSHHRQVFETKADPRKESMSSIYRRFVDQGEWRPLWKYLFGLLYRSQAPIGLMISVCGTLRYASVTSPLWSILPITRKRRKSMREATLIESLIRAKMALNDSPKRLTPVDEQTLRQAATSFIENGSTREMLALTLVSAYWQKGADLDHALELWFPLVDLNDPTPKWSDSPRTRSRIRLWNQGRRRYLVESAISHLFGNASHISLAVATPASEIPIFREPNAHRHSGSPLGSLAPGQGIELFSENEYTYSVRSSGGIEGFVSKETMLREPVLPSDKKEPTI